MVKITIIAKNNAMLSAKTPRNEKVYVNSHIMWSINTFKFYDAKTSDTDQGQDDLFNMETMYRRPRPHCTV